MKFNIRPLTALAFALGILGLAQAGRLAFDATNAQAAGEPAQKGPSESAANASEAAGPPMCLPVDLAKEAGISAAEFRLLQSLQERRQTLDARERDLVTRDNLLKATDGRIGERMAALKGVESNIQKLLGQVDELEAQRLASLVSVYEKMKPKDAARILEGLDTEVLIKIAQRMKTQPMALILANMSGERARLVTQRLAAIDNPDLAPMAANPIAPAPAPSSLNNNAPRTPVNAGTPPKANPTGPAAKTVAPAAGNGQQANTPATGAPSASTQSAAKAAPTGAGPNPPTPPVTPQPVTKAASGQSAEPARAQAGTARASAPKG